MPPLISICLPTLNSARFLTERIDSIKAQSLTDWEVVAFDSYSSDGTTEMLLEWSKNDSRVHVHSSAPDGIYTNINRCIEHGHGKYVYIATSDDIMAADCLEKLTKSLEQNEDCDIAHCPLRIFDENNELIDHRNAQWQNTSSFARSSKELLNTDHLRRAPFDGLLHAFGSNVYISLTQILIRKSTFGEIGLFQSTWGSIGDFAWEMRAALRFNTVHTASTWAGWRIHSDQATHSVRFKSTQHREKVREMIADSLNSATEHLSGTPFAAKAKEITNTLFAYRIYRSKVAEEKSILARLTNAAVLACLGSPFARQYLKEKLLASKREFDPMTYLQDEFIKLNGAAPISPLRCESETPLMKNRTLSN